MSIHNNPGHIMHLYTSFVALKHAFSLNVPFTCLQKCDHNLEVQFNGDANQSF